MSDNVLSPSEGHSSSPKMVREYYSHSAEKGVHKCPQANHFSVLDLYPGNPADEDKILRSHLRLVKLQLKPVKLVVMCVHYNGDRGGLQG
jgi:hypothetical protein